MTLDLPCTLCKSRGFVCGAEDKIWGPGKYPKLPLPGREVKNEITIWRPPPLLPDEGITRLDSKYINHIMENLKLPGALPPAIESILKIRGITGHVLGNPVSMTMAIPWPQFTLHSRPFRFAVLAISSSILEGEDNKIHTFTYLSQYYKFAQEAIQASSLLEVVAASYTILLYSYMGDESFETLFVHFKGLSSGIALLHEKSGNEVKWVEVLWRAGLQLLLRKFWKRNQFKYIPKGELELLIELYRILQERTSHSVFTDPSIEGPWTNSSYTRLEILGCCLSMYWDLYLAFQKVRSLERDVKLLRSLVESIKHTLEEILDLVRNLPNPRELLRQAEADVRSWWSESTEVPGEDMRSPKIHCPHQITFEDDRAALLYAYAKLIKIFIQLPAHTDISCCVSSALLLCRLCAPAVTGYLARSSPFALQMTRYLFWTGLVLQKTEHPVGETEIFDVDHSQ